MTNQTNPQWDAWDNEARAELTASFPGFVETTTKGGNVDHGGTATVYRGEAKLGYVDVDPTLIEWVIQTRRIFLEKPFRFDKALHATGEYQPRWGLFLMEKVFEQFPEKEIRESPVGNDPLGIPFVKRVRGEYAMPYHQPECFLNDERLCTCGVDRPRATAL